MDEAWSDTSISQVDGAMDTPLERPGKTVEVEGEKLEEEEASMTGWSQVRRKKGQVETDVVAGSRGREEYQKQKGQVETDVVAGSRGWEEYRRKFPYVAYKLRHGWSEREEVKKWLAGGDEKEYRREEEGSKRSGGEPRKKKVKEQSPNQRLPPLQHLLLPQNWVPTGRQAPLQSLM